MTLRTMGGSMTNRLDPSRVYFRHVHLAWLHSFTNFFITIRRPSRRAKPSVFGEKCLPYRHHGLPVTSSS